MILTGAFRYQRTKDVADKMDDGWRYCRDLGIPHGQWSVLMWWCCGACEDHEVPQ